MLLRTVIARFTGRVRRRGYDGARALADSQADAAWRRHREWQKGGNDPTKPGGNHGLPTGLGW